MISPEIFEQMAVEILAKVDEMRNDYKNGENYLESYLSSISDKIKKVYEIICE